MQDWRNELLIWWCIIKKNVKNTKNGTQTAIKWVRFDKAATLLTIRNSFTSQDIASTINHSLVGPDLTQVEVLEGCELAARYRVLAVSVKPCYIKLAAERLSGTGVRVGGVVGFPHGSSQTAIKVAEAEGGLRDGAVELDMVINIGALRGRQCEFVLEDIRAVREVCSGTVVLKVILETAYLTEEEIILGCQWAEQVGADLVKTSSGYAGRGASLADVRLMRASVGLAVGVKASGGIRTLEQVISFLQAGAVQIGTSATATIMTEAEKLESTIGA